MSTHSLSTNPLAVGIAGFVIALVLAAPSAASEEPNEGYSELGADTCLLCHRDAVTLQLFDEIHGDPNRPGAPFGAGGLQCESCHGPGRRHAASAAREHGELVAFGSGEPAGLKDTACAGCHEPADHAAAVACADCHRVHGTDPMTTSAGQRNQCGGCHGREAAAFERAYSHPVAAGAMACSDCHHGHGPALAQRAEASDGPELCFGCHAEKRGPVLFEHAPVAEDCGHCHAPHGASHPGMLVRRAPFLCQSCHAEQGHPSLRAELGTVNLLAEGCQNCHSQVHGSNHPSGEKLMR